MAAQQEATHQLEKLMYDQVPIVLMYYWRQLGALLHEELHRVAVGRGPVHAAHAVQQRHSHGGHPPEVCVLTGGGAR